MERQWRRKDNAASNALDRTAKDADSRRRATLDAVTGCERAERAKVRKHKVVREVLPELVEVSKAWGRGEEHDFTETAHNGPVTVQEIENKLETDQEYSKNIAATLLKYKTIYKALYEKYLQIKEQHDEVAAQLEPEFESDGDGLLDRDLLSGDNQGLDRMSIGD